jgi:hypothetical protein
MNWKIVLSCLLLGGVAAGCSTTTTNPSANYGPGMSPHALYPRTDGPQIDNSDAAGPASVPGTMTAAPIVVPPTAAASPAIIVPPASDTVIVAPPAQPR